MNGVIPNSGKYACIVLETNVVRALTDPYTFGNGLYAFFRSPFKPDNMWTESLGTFHDKRVSDSNLFLFAFSTDSSADDRYLERIVTMLHYGLLIQGKAYSTDGLILAGLNRDLHVSSVSTSDRYYWPYKVIGSSIDMEVLNTCRDIVRGVNIIFSKEDSYDFLRLRKGFNAFIRGIREGREGHFRLHQFVRAIEAVIKPDVGNTTKQFIHRGQVFVGRSEKDREFLRELFEMRSAAEHLNPIKDKLDKYSDYERERIVPLRIYQAELLAGHAYSRILTDPSLLSMFISDDTINQFWKQTEKEQMSVWGKPIDLEKAAEGKFFDYGYL